MTYYKKGSRKFLLDRLLPLLKEIVKKALSSFISLHDTQIVIKNFLHFFQQSIRMSGKSINFEYKIIDKTTFYKNKKLFNIYDLNVNIILVFKNKFVAPLRENAS